MYNLKELENKVKALEEELQSLREVLKAQEELEVVKPNNDSILETPNVLNIEKSNILDITEFLNAKEYVKVPFPIPVIFGHQVEEFSNMYMPIYFEKDWLNNVFESIMDVSLDSLLDNISKGKYLELDEESTDEFDKSYLRLIGKAKKDNQDVYALVEEYVEKVLEKQIDCTNLNLEILPEYRDFLKTFSKSYDATEFPTKVKPTKFIIEGLEVSIVDVMRLVFEDLILCDQYENVDSLVLDEIFEDEEFLKSLWDDAWSEEKQGVLDSLSIRNSKLRYELECFSEIPTIGPNICDKIEEYGYSWTYYGEVFAWTNEVEEVYKIMYYYETKIKCQKAIIYRDFVDHRKAGSLHEAIFNELKKITGDSEEARIREYQEIYLPLCIENIYIKDVNLSEEIEMCIKNAVEEVF